MRFLFGDLVSDWTFTTATASGVENLAQLVGGVEITFWSERIGGWQYTDLRDMADQPITSVTSSSGTDNRAIGQIPMFWGPEGVTELWAQAGVDGPRARMVPVNTAALLTEHMNDTTLHQGIGGDDPAKGAPGVLYVVAAGASEAEKARAHFVCDGTNDNEEIQAAIEQLRAGRGGRVLLSGGLFYLGAPIDLYGLDDVDLEQELYLTGMGPSATQLVAGAGLPAAIRLGKSVRAHVWDLGIQVTGATSGITATQSVAPTGGHRSAWFSSIERVQVLGPWDGTHTGWAMDLGNLFRSTIRNVEVGGTGNGIRLRNEDADFNAGDCIVERVFVDLVGDGATAYALTSTAGNMNQVSFDTCHAIAEGSNTTCWLFDGAGSTSHIRTRNCNAEKFKTTVKIASGEVYDVDVDLVHVTLVNGSTLADVTGYNNRVRCGLAYVEPNASVTLIRDTNSYDAKPNIYGPIDIWADAGATVTSDLQEDYAELRDITADGDGTIDLSVTHSPLINAPHKVIDLGNSGTGTLTLDGRTGSHWRVTATGNFTLGNPVNLIDGQLLLLEVQQDATGGRTVSTGSKFRFYSQIPAPLAISTAPNSKSKILLQYDADADKVDVIGLLTGAA